MKPLNPFIITGEYAGPEYFCDRETEAKTLRDNLLNGRNTVLVSPRRMGKTSLISHVLFEPEVSTRFRTFSVDLFATSSLREMVILLGKEIVSCLKSRQEKNLDTFISVVKSLRAGFKMDPVSGALEFDISLGDIVRPHDSLEEIFAYLEKSEIPCIVAIDEFQQIADYPEKNVIAALRTHVQKCTNAWFIFAGSKRRMMDKLFNNPSEPFYQSCADLYLDVIDKDKYRTFAKRHFNLAGKTLSDDCFDIVYDRFEGHTWYVQRLLNELYSQTQTGDAATAVMFQPVLDYVVSSAAKSFEEQFATYPEAQKQLLIAIAKEGKVSSITSISFVKKHAIKSPSTAQSAARALYDNEIITRDGTVYSITNRFFSLWLARTYGKV